ncbi:LOW QUALITY PROTEIN: ankyrin repeat and SOCS box protein 3 [Tachysurus fulvidraco]|uniref:LOW QUALITY PROTEIN: ankyrin repeat and SOCS box protein 3 n=1 Tax=Tachysurus fulvidraco TaxID=1234273 RepID=UPI001FEE6FCD|nr:LOW QUALITY PROTEIN: ankyrin repeat and SOCS box protein 3 [Tachysurus fulvidraco]
MIFTECYQDTCSAVALAARRGDYRLLQRLLKNGQSVDVKDNRGWCALHEAAAGGHAQCVRLLLSASASDNCEDYVNSLTHNSETSLYFAAMNGHLRAARHLIRAGADLDKMSNDLSSPLFAAVDSGHKEVVELLVSEGAEVNRRYYISSWSCLHQAVYKGHAEIVRFLVNVCSLEIVDDYGITPLFVAAQYGHQHCLEILANAGANVNCQAKDMATPLLIASQEGHLSCVELLLAHNADPNLYCNEEKWQLPIHAAAQFSRISILEKLIPVTNRECDRGWGLVSPVYLAVVSGQAESLLPLLREGYSPDAQSCKEFGYSCPLDMVLGSNFWSAGSDLHQSREITKMLLVAGARVSLDTYIMTLQGDVPEHLPLILEYSGLPKGKQLEALVQATLSKVAHASFWLPLLLKAGLDPLLLLEQKMLEEAESTVLNFLLDFINWKTLPSTLLHILSQRRAQNTWTPHKHFESVPDLTHLCRLAVRATVGSHALSKSSFVRQLPVPTLLQDYLQFSDVSSAYTFTASADRESVN